MLTALADELMPMSDSSHRRRVLALIGTGAVTTVAGCLSGDEQDDTSGPASENGDTSVEDLMAADVVSEDDVNGFVAEFEVDADAPISGKQVVYGDDFYLEEDVSGIERYAVGDTIYIVHGSQCFAEDRGDHEDVDGMYVASEPVRGTPLDEIPVTDVTTIDGEEAYVIEVDEMNTMYVSTETGYRVRDEWGESGVADLHSWGETDPIIPPDMDCQQS